MVRLFTWIILTEKEEMLLDLVNDGLNLKQAYKACSWKTEKWKGKIEALSK
jgi:hypothetical protein